MTAKSPTQSRALVAAFAAGLLVSNVAGRFIAGAGAVENTNGMRPAMGFRAVPIQITPAPAPDQLLALQQRMDALESTLFGARAAGDRPRQIQSNVIGDLQNRAEQIAKVASDNKGDIDGVRSDLAGVHNTVFALGGKLNAQEAKLADTGVTLNTLRGSFYSHRHQLYGAKEYGIVIGGVTRFVPASAGAGVQYTTEPFCGDSQTQPECN